jgi:hypothetical protein
MGTASAAKARAFARKPKGASAQNAGSKAASASWEKRQSGLAPSTLLKKYNSSLKSAATPATFVLIKKRNGYEVLSMIGGARPYAYFKAVLDEAVNK